MVTASVNNGSTARADAAPRRPVTAAAAKSRERVLFEALQPDPQDSIPASSLAAALEAAGLRLDDPRLADTRRALRSVATEHEIPDRLDFAEFGRVIKPSILIIEQALQRRLAIPEFGQFAAELQRIFDSAAADRSGKVADYIPQLGRVNPEQFGVAFCTIDGQRVSLGDAAVPFCLQSTSKPITYCIALEERGEDVVHRHVGCEPSGQSFNELTLNKQGRPHNPLINAGAIMAGSLIRPGADMADRFDHVLEMWQRLAGGARPGFSNPTYLSERRTADRNFALGYFMREKGAFPEGTDLVETLEFYFQCCSLELTAESLSVVAATLANGGVCPVTGDRVFQADTVQKCLSLMSSCGMYDFSGEWAFRIGLPAKSGVSGAVMVVVPNVLGFCTWSPRLDQIGNSVRGIAFCRELVRTFSFHHYDSVGGGHGRKDPRQKRDQGRRSLTVDLYWAASEGDLDGIRRLVVSGVDVDEPDYDGRTALHLAASEGQSHVVAYLLTQGVTATPVDRWGNTPADDARRGTHTAVVELLDGANGPAKAARRSV